MANLEVNDWFYKGLMNLKQQLLLGPLEKYERFGLPPFKALLSVALVFLTTFEVLSVIDENIFCNSEQRKSFMALYFDPSIYEDEIFEQSQFFHIQQAKELQEHFKYMFESLNNVTQSSFQKISLENATMWLSKSDIYYSRDPSQIVTSYPISFATGLQEPFDYTNISSIKQFLLSTAMFEISVDGVTLDVSGIATRWTHSIKYEFTSRAQIDISVDMHPAYNSKLEIEDERGDYFKLLTGFYVLVVVVAVWSLILNYRYFRRLVNGLNEYNRNISIEGCNLARTEITPKYMFTSVLEWAVANRIPMRALTWGETLDIVDVWIIIGTVGNLFQVLGSTYLILTHKSTIMVGMGCIISWMVLFKFLRRYEKMVLLNQVLSMSFPRIMIFMGEFIPMFFSFTIFGATVFWRCELFSSVRKTIATQMCLLLGDSINMITRQIGQQYGGLLAIFYVFAFVLLFMQAIHNMLTGLIKEKFVLYKIQLAKKDLKSRGLHHLKSLSEIKMGVEQEKDHLPIEYSSLFQAQMERKRRKGQMDLTMNKLELTFSIADKEIRKIIADFDHDARVYTLSDLEYHSAKTDLENRLLVISQRLGVMRRRLR